MRFQVKPGGSITGRLRAPGDKSISHRTIMLGSIAEGITEATGFLEGQDALCTVNAFRAMGVTIDGPRNGQVRVQGVGLHGLKEPNETLDMGNSGTSIRLISGLLAAQSFDATMTGDASLTKRPMGRVITPLQQMGAVIDSHDERPPLTVRGGQSLKGIHYVMPMASAQVKSCVLLAGLYAEGRTSVIEPAPTRDHTERMLQGFGYAVDSENGVISLSGGGNLQGAQLDIPADISSAAFFLVAASISEGSDLILEHVGINPTRSGVITILTLMGADIEIMNERTVGGEPVADLSVRSAKLKGIEIPEELVPLAIDEFPVLFIAAACADGETVLSGAEELRVKESDRIASMAEGLTRLGIANEVMPDGIRIQGGRMTGGEIDTYHDHRIAMSFSIAALRANGDIIVNDCDHVATSFPNFASLSKGIGLRITEAL